MKLIASEKKDGKHSFEENFKRVKLECFLLIFLISSCSFINTNSRDYYKGKKQIISHGLVYHDFQDEKFYFDYEKARKGRSLYKIHCTGCHNLDGTSNLFARKNYPSIPDDLKNVIVTKQDVRFYVIISNASNKKMPGWKHEFTDKELLELSNYLREMGLDRSKHIN